jgi:hypothetical protein
VLDVAMNGGHGGQTELGRDLLETGGVPLLFDKGRNEVKDLSLSPSECHRIRHLRVSFGCRVHENVAKVKGRLEKVEEVRALAVQLASFIADDER